MLQGLEQRGMVTRRRAAHSERVVEILLTAERATALHNQQQRLRDKQLATFESLDANEQAVIVTLLAKLTALANEL
jgi:DNA-binding MarR family transcriptional regulator